MTKKRKEERARCDIILPIDVWSIIFNLLDFTSYISLTASCFKLSQQRKKFYHPQSTFNIRSPGQIKTLEHLAFNKVYIYPVVTKEYKKRLIPPKIVYFYCDNHGNPTDLFHLNVNTVILSLKNVCMYCKKQHNEFPASLSFMLKQYKIEPLKPKKWKFTLQINN